MSLSSADSTVKPSVPCLCLTMTVKLSRCVSGVNQSSVHFTKGRSEMLKSNICDCKVL